MTTHPTLVLVDVFAATLPTLAVDSPLKVAAPPPVVPAVPVTVSTSPPLILRV